MAPPLKQALREAGPVADLPMRRLQLPQQAVGRDYILIQIKIQGKGPYDFMLDSGLTGELITPHLRTTLGEAFGAADDTSVTGFAAGGVTSASTLVALSGATLCGGDFTRMDGSKADELDLPELRAFVTDFPQEHMDPAHDPVEGMLGMEVLSLFDVDFDFPAGRLRLWAPGTAARKAIQGGLVEVPAAVLNETGLLGIRLTSAQQLAGSQPIVGIIDCGSSFSVVNWAGAELLGLPPKGDRAAYSNSPTILGIGVDGRPQPLPTKEVRLTFSGQVLPKASTGGKLRFAPPPEFWQPWDPVQMAVGDLPAFSKLLGDGRSAFKGPAALIGLDVLAQRRVILETSTGSDRRRRLFVS
eukprot:gene20141-24109_t